MTFCSRPSAVHALLPPEVVVVEADSPRMWEEGLQPKEEAYVARAVDKRRREFRAGRNCAKRALALLGARASPLLPGEQREPGWPPGVVGSITHVDGYCAAAVAWSDHVSGLGIDAEIHAPLPEGVTDLVCTPAEAVWMRSAPKAGGLYWDSVIFSAKESVYKAWFPIAGGWLDFAEAELLIDPPQGAFEVRLLVPPPVSRDGRPLKFRGRFAVAGRYVLTAVTVFG